MPRQAKAKYNIVQATVGSNSFDRWHCRPNEFGPTTKNRAVIAVSNQLTWEGHHAQAGKGKIQYSSGYCRVEFIRPMTLPAE